MVPAGAVAGCNLEEHNPTANHTISPDAQKELSSTDLFTYDFAGPPVHHVEAGYDKYGNRKLTNIESSKDPCLNGTPYDSTKKPGIRTAEVTTTNDGVMVTPYPSGGATHLI